MRWGVQLAELAQEVEGAPEEAGTAGGAGGDVGADSAAARRQLHSLAARAAVEEDLMMRVPLSKVAIQIFRNTGDVHCMPHCSQQECSEGFHQCTPLCATHFEASTVVSKQKDLDPKPCRSGVEADSTACDSTRTARLPSLGVGEVRRISARA